MYPNSLKKLIEALTKLPGIGAKTAERLALHLAIEAPKEELITFSKSLIELKDSIKTCHICGVLTDYDTCVICQDEQRDEKLLMVVADSKDVFALEHMQTYQGRYHILNGLIDFSRGIEPQDLNIDSIQARLDRVEEVIIATNSTVEGELTAQYLKSILADAGVAITRLGYGLPVGADLKYADELTLIKAVENRQKY